MVVNGPAGMQDKCMISSDDKVLLFRIYYTSGSLINMGPNGPCPMRKERETSDFFSKKCLLHFKGSLCGLKQRILFLSSLIVFLKAK